MEPQPVWSDFYLSFDGRVSRGQFWLRWLLPAAALQILFVFFILWITGDFSSIGDRGSVSDATRLLVGAFNLILLWPSLAVTVKRLHDIGWSGWAIAALLIPVVGSFVIWVATWFFAGKFGTNMYGPDPRFAHERHRLRTDYAGRIPSGESTP